MSSKHRDELRRLNEMVPVLEQKLRELSKINEGLHAMIAERNQAITELEGRIIVLHEEKEAIWSLIEMELGPDDTQPEQEGPQDL